MSLKNIHYFVDWSVFSSMWKIGHTKNKSSNQPVYSAGQKIRTLISCIFCAPPPWGKGANFENGTSLLLQGGYKNSDYQMAVQKLSKRLVFRGFCAEGILYP